jgi:DHA1 family tetracycline resistance protein-like MFS transporter
VVIPVLPKLVGSFYHGDLGSASRTFGAFVALYSAMQFLFAPVLGGLSDRYGRRPVLLGSLFGAAVNYLLTALAPGLGFLVLGRIIAGITGASFSAAGAYIADVTPPEKRAQSFGLMGAAFGVGFILGPALGGALGGISLRLPFYFSAALNFLNFLYGWFVLPESHALEHRRAFSFARANPFASLRSLGRHRIVLGLTGTIVCGYLAQMILQSVWALFNEGRFGWTPADIGFSLAMVGLCSALVQGGLIRAIIPRLGERRALLVGLLLNIGGFVGFAFAARGWMIYAIIVPFSLGGISGPAVQALISREIGPDEQGELQGALASLNSLTSIAGALIGTRLFERFGPAGAVPHFPGAPFLAAAIFNALGLLLAARLFGTMPRSGPADGGA